MSSIDFYYSPGSAPCRSVIMVAEALGVKLNKKLLNLRAGEHMTPEFLAINPQHTIPTLVDNGFAIWESRAILIYLVQKYGKYDDSLYSKVPKTRALINQRLQFDMSVLFKSFIDFIYPQMIAKLPADPEKKKAVENALALLDTFLEGQLYVVEDEGLTIADIAILASVSTFEVAGFDFSKFVNVSKWYENAKQVTPGWAENWEGCLEARKYFDSA